MNKYEFKYMYEQETMKVENLIDVVGKNAHHIQDLSAELKKKDAIKKDFIERQTKKSSKDEILKRWSTDIHSKMSVATIKGKDGSAAIKLPSAPESN